MRVKRIEAQVTTEDGEKLFLEFSAHDPGAMELTIDSMIGHPGPEELFPRMNFQASAAEVDHTLTVDDIRTWRWTRMDGVHLAWVNDEPADDDRKSR